MKALIVENNVIAQVVAEDATFEVVPAWRWVDCPAECEAYTWTYDGQTFSPPEVTPVVTPIPTLNQRQIRFVLNAAGLRETVEAMVTQADQYTKDWWEFSEEYKHDHPVLVQMAGQLSLTSEQVEQMFRDGALM